MNTSTYIIAEAGVNHNGDLDIARQLVQEAAAAGADAVKFQTFKAENLVTRQAQKAVYQKQTTAADESQFNMLKRLELKPDAHFELKALAEQLDIEFLSTAFDHQSLDFLVHILGLRRLKIPSGEITNGPLVLEHARTGCELILSTGMASLSEVEEILGVVAFGLISKSDVQPSRKAFRDAYDSREGQAALLEKVSLLHCTTEYPAPMEDINLRAMQTMAKQFGLVTGYSDHSEGITIPVAAVAMGAQVVEKHFTLDRTMEGPDHRASLEPSELKAMVSGIRNVELARGDGNKRSQPSELKNMAIARKSLVAAADIAPGEAFGESNLTVKRPGHGISPMEYWDILGKQASRAYQQDEVIE